jgi:hypothetical protein
MKSISRLGAVVLTLGAVAALPGPALAKPKPKTALHNHAVNLSGWIDTVVTTGKLGVPGVRDTDAGILKGSVSGAPRWNGAISQIVTWGTALRITVHGTAFDTHGTLRYSITGQFGPGPKGLALNGVMTVTGGTGIYARAGGRLRVTGAAPVGTDTDASTFDLSGKLRF